MRANAVGHCQSHFLEGAWKLGKQALSLSAFSGRVPPFIIFYLMGRRTGWPNMRMARLLRPIPIQRPQCKHTMPNTGWFVRA